MDPLGFVTLPLKDLRKTAQAKWLDLIDESGKVIGAVHLNLWVDQSLPSLTAAAPTGDTDSGMHYWFCYIRGAKGV